MPTYWYPLILLNHILAALFGIGSPTMRKQSWRKSRSNVNCQIVFSIRSLFLYRSFSFLRAALCSASAPKARWALARNSCFHFLTMLGLRLFYAQMALNSLSPCWIAIMFFVLNSGVYFLFGMILSSIFCMYLIYHARIFLQNLV